MATTAKAPAIKQTDWKEYKLVGSRTDPTEKHRVQRHVTTGDLRCTCGDYIFGWKRRGVPVTERNCAHLDFVREMEAAQREAQPHYRAATQIVQEMLGAAAVFTFQPHAVARMVETLAPYLGGQKAVATDTPSQPRVPLAGQLRFRLITLEGDES